ncbi:MAG: hypothetical protein NTU73_15010 [Ignavibacteriae bacterium]|nr:hypothetical protein [Ignavibacteriota bacterium]
MNKSHKIILFVSLGSVILIAEFIIGILGLAWLFNSMIYSLSPESYAEEYKDKLPKTATEISEKIIDAFPDWDYYLRAKITQAEFQKFVEDLNLKINKEQKFSINVNYDSLKYNKDINDFNGDSTEYRMYEYNKNFNKQYKGMEWWKVKNINDIYYTAYYRKDKTLISGEVLATYEEGYLYLFVRKY